jgi:hypothetical protein
MVEPAPRICRDGWSELAEKIVQKVGVFSSSEKTPVRTPRSPRIPPRSHQQKTIPKHPLFPKDPSKTQETATRQPHQFFLQKGT